MDQKQIKDFIAQKVPEGYSLSKIQDMLKEQGVHITFMELRLLASEIEEQVWKQTEKDDAPPSAEEPAADTAQEDAMEADSVQDASEDPVPPAEPQQDASAVPRGKTVVELSKIARPGAAASGTVKFGSGVTAEWIIDQMGRLGLDKASGQPDQQDIREFQMELQKLFAGA